MTTPENKQSRPDVESIINKIRENLEPPSSADIPMDENVLREEDNLQGNLAAANAVCAVGLIKKGGLKGFILRCLYKLFSVFLGEINQFHSSVIRVLNKLVKMIEGRDASSYELIDNIRRRMDLMEKLSRRMDAYDALQIEERLKKMEEQMAKARHKETL